MEVMKGRILRNRSEATIMPTMKRVYKGIFPIIPLRNGRCGVVIKKYIWQVAYQVCQVAGITGNV